MNKLFGLALCLWLAVPSFAQNQWFAICERATGKLVSIGTVYSELPAQLEAISINGPLLPNEQWNAATKAKVQVQAVVTPTVTKQQAATVLKNLLEDPPTGADPWTATQRDQAVYLLLLGLFRDLQNGVVY